MKLIKQEFMQFQEDTNNTFGGLKIIYCTPRSFDNEQIRESLDECLRFKKEWPELIAGKFCITNLEIKICLTPFRLRSRR